MVQETEVVGATDQAPDTEQDVAEATVTGVGLVLDVAREPATVPGQAAEAEAHAQHRLEAIAQNAPSSALMTVIHESTIVNLANTNDPAESMIVNLVEAGPVVVPALSANRARTVNEVQNASCGSTFTAAVQSLMHRRLDPEWEKS